jgi:hypothetical protein
MQTPPAVDRGRMLETIKPDYATSAPARRRLEALWRLLDGWLKILQRQDGSSRQGIRSVLNHSPR